jgi:hypothetical protein
MAKLLRRKSSISGLTTDLSNIKNAVGLSNELLFSADANTNYIASATSFANAEFKLDAEIKSVNDSIGDSADLETTASTLVEAINEVKSLADDAQDELDATQTGAGLETDGSYAANSGANYIATATSLKDADNKLDAQIKVNTDAISTLNGDDETEGSVAKAIADITGGATGSLKDAEDRLDILEGDAETEGSIAKAIADVIGAAPAALDTLKEIADFLDTNPDADPLSGLMQVVEDAKDELKGSVSEAFDTLEEIEDALDIINGSDTTNGSIAKAQKTVQDAVNTVEASIGLSVDGAHVATTGNYTSTATTLVGEIAALDTELKAANTRAIVKDGSVAFTAAQSMGGFKLTNVAAGTASTDAVNKGQMETAISSQANVTGNLSAVVTADGKVVFSKKPIGGVEGIAFGVVRVFGVDGVASAYDEVEVTLDSSDAEGKTFTLASSEDYSTLTAKAFVLYNPTV